MPTFIFIICEYSPPHKGHEYMISYLRQLYPDATITAIMSGHFTQRGSPAVTDKFTRAVAALKCGADLVLSLPFPLSCGSAEFFAGGGVYIANEISRAISFDTGKSFYIAFGSESGDVSLLQKYTAQMSSPEFAAVRTARDRADLYNKLYGGDNAFLHAPNDILGIEYIRALTRLQSDIKPLCVKRIGMPHNRDIIDGYTGKFVSSSYIRSLIYKGDISSAVLHIPESCRDIISDALTKRGAAASDNMSQAILALLRMADADRIDNIAECGEGVGRRILSAALSASSYDEMLASAAAKSHTNARLRRAAVYAACGVTADALREYPQYTQLLAANGRGTALLRSIRDKCDIDILTKAADYGKMKPAAVKQYQLEQYADRLYTMCFSPALPSDIFIRMSPYIEK